MHISPSEAMTDNQMQHDPMWQRYSKTPGQAKDPNDDLASKLKRAEGTNGMLALALQAANAKATALRAEATALRAEVAELRAQRLAAAPKEQPAALDYLSAALSRAVSLPTVPDVYARVR